MKLKVIKVIQQNTFELMLGEDDRNQYFIVFEANEHQHISEPIKDYGMASFMFDLKLRELEGH